ncbi:3-demethylubiquinone-9 3-O-methyltransferase [Tremella mesenterica]|uniref:Ubiquinone biosynthesis O-methyltransferase, mitochondrial n=1 Tax=Tremella mesenterica TaxID=5217 RepID=A0A4Q1B9K5_TREME|nr:3-demethylubiquinone-9 3-O-methyltransferase [Tremella mesenterica]
MKEGTSLTSTSRFNISSVTILHLFYPQLGAQCKDQDTDPGLSIMSRSIQSLRNHKPSLFSSTIPSLSTPFSTQQIHSRSISTHLPTHSLNSSTSPFNTPTPPNNTYSQKTSLLSNHPNKSHITRSFQNSQSQNPTSARRNHSTSTVNPSEIAHFARLSSEWWDEKGEFGLLHRMNPIRIEYIRQKIQSSQYHHPFTSLSSEHNQQQQQFPSEHNKDLHTSPNQSTQRTQSQPLESEECEEEWTFSTRHQMKEENPGYWLSGKKILDVGCGGGLLSESLTRLGGDVLGIDASEKNIIMAKLHAQDGLFNLLSSDTSPHDIQYTGAERKGMKGNLEYKCMTAEKLRDQGKKFDLVVSMEVLEHVDQPEEFLKCLGDMVKPGGHLILSTISRTPLSRFLTITMAESILGLVSKGTHTWNKFIRPEELKRFVHSDMGGHSIWQLNSDSSDIQTDQVGSTQGMLYNPLIGKWVLMQGVEGTFSKKWNQGCNYLFHARKRREPVYENIEGHVVETVYGRF